MGQHLNPLRYERRYGRTLPAGLSVQYCTLITSAYSGGVWARATGRVASLAWVRLRLSIRVRFTPDMHLRNLTARGFELRLYVGSGAPNGPAETCTARRLNPVLFENMAALQEAWVPDKCFVQNILRVSALDRISWRESSKILSSKELRLRLNYVL
jgi:hypothetical protein